MPPRMIAPPIPTQTPMTVFFVLLDIPFDASLLSALSVATDVEIDVDVLLETIVDEKVLPPAVLTITCVVT